MRARDRDRTQAYKFCMRDARRLQAYFEEVATDIITRFDALNFLRAARHLNSPMLDALREVTEGAVPPVVTSTR